LDFLPSCILATAPVLPGLWGGADDYLHGDEYAALLERLRGVIPEAQYIKPLVSLGFVAIERSLDPVFELVDHDRFDVSVNGVISILEVNLVGKESVEQLAKAFVDVARSIQSSYLTLRQPPY
jgi:hypothetical protein